MTTRNTRTIRRASTAALLAASLTFSLAACGGDEEPVKPEKSASAGQTGDDKNKGTEGGKTYPDTNETIATLKGAEGMELVVHEAKRDGGGFLTISGEFNNTSEESYVTPVQWSGDESDVKQAGRSIAAMTLVDSQGKKRYYVLRDTDNRPLTTTKFSPSIKAGESLPFFAQFPAPPETTTTVDLQFPGFPSAPIELS